MDEFEVSPNLYVLNPSLGPKGENLQIFGVHGFGAVDDHPISRVSDLSEIVSSWSRNEFISNWAERVRGAVSLYIFEPVSSCVRILPDPLGGSINFYYSRDGISAVSSNLKDLIQALELVGIRPRKSLKFAIELVVSTNGGLNQSSYEDIKAVPILSYMKVSAGGLELLPYRNISFRSEDALPYEEMLKRSAREIENTVKAATRHRSETKICHLTGGFDSRLVAAATLSSGTSDSFKYFCQGDPVLPDKVLAESVAADLGITMTNYSGIEWDFAPNDFGGGLLGPMNYSSGLLPVGPHQGNCRSDSVILSGGYGGTFRSTYDYRFPDRNGQALSGSELGNSLWGEYLFSGGDGSLLTREYSIELSERIESYMNNGREHGVREDALGDLFYIQSRARYFISHITSSWNTLASRIDPLYSPVAIHGALSMPLKFRASNVIGYDLANILDSRILSMPFDTSKFDLEAAGRTSEISAVEFSGAKAKYDGRVPSKITSRDFGYLRIPKATKDDVATAKSMRARAYQIAGRNAARNELKELVASIPRSELGELINLEELDILTKRPANTRVRIRTLFNLYSSLKWYVE
ncbi:hypothetical protein ACT3UD_16255 [Glutamicibacter sp. 287]|uniref:hypothetical protein n=1 Tax=Glutamicibacter sp. 287 TaxID=3457732 RepID=UPI0040343EBA